ncbi:sulfatase-like hydrolase/transferase [Sphingopyxis sp. CCNWLW253]|uniref:sulfatase-like hydrolase/transferase n=1 Tax=unclassified Sphingopyxis TaxID=2614943 RepID=UPI0030131495
MVWTVDRRTFVGGLGGAGALAASGARASVSAADGRKLNILMIVTDQEQSVASFPKGLLEKLPGHRELMARGLLVENYHVQTTPCSPSRSTIFTGHHTQRTGIYLNSSGADDPVLPTDLPTLGHMMRSAGYYTSYKGKWHLSPINEKRNWNQVSGMIYPATEKAMEEYGFDDYGFDGEAVGLTWDGYRHDQYIAADASRSILDFKERDKAAGKPWFMVVGLLNPHDIMFYDATGKQTASRAHPNLLGPLRREPGDPLYAEDNGFDLPESFHSDDLSGKPEAHRGIVASSTRTYGALDHADEASWRRFRNYYYNCIRDMDRRIGQLLWALEASGQMENTIILFTSDHGERAGAHGMRQKGGTIYREETNVPMMIVHPDAPGGRRSRGLMSAVDIAPTLLALAGKDTGWRKEHYPDLPGVDMTPLLADPDARTERDIRGHLFNYAVGYGWAPKAGQPAAAPFTDRFDLTRRRLHRGVHDGRWKFARYFAPAHHRQPRNWAELSANNDLELYDTHADPNEIVNLASHPDQRRNLLRLNAMANALIAREVGRDDGSEYPGPTEIYNRPWPG